ncbi:hypothetical protein D3C73_185900 [compost metagenome]
MSIWHTMYLMYHIGGIVKSKILPNTGKNAPSTSISTLNLFFSSLLNFHIIFLFHSFLTQFCIVNAIVNPLYLLTFFTLHLPNFLHFYPPITLNPLSRLLFYDFTLTIPTFYPVLYPIFVHFPLYYLHFYD